MSKNTLHSFRFLIAPVAVMLIGKILFELLAFKFPELNQILIEHFSEIKDFSTTISLQETKARLLWVTSVIMYFFVCTVFLAFIWNILHRSLSKSNLLMFILVALFFVMIEIIYLYQAEPLTSPLITIFLFTYDSLIASKHYSDNELSIIYNILSIVNLITIVITPFGIMTGCCIMHRQQSSANMNLNDLRTHSNNIKELLTGGSAIMVIGIAHMQLWLSWPLSFLSDKQLIQQIEAITLAVSQYWGVIYTLTMAALYLPAAFSLSEQARQIIQQGHDQEAKNNPDQWLVQNKVILSLNAQLPQLVAVIAPMLVGSFGSSLGNIMPF